MLFSLSLPQRQTIDNIVALGVKSEELNYNGIWLGDHYFNRNVFITLGLLSRSTDRILLGTGVTNPFHLSPAMLASTGCSLQELSNGRFRMGIGTGDTRSLLDEGITKPPDLLRVMANHIKFMKRLSSGISLKNPSQENAGSMPAMINYAGKKTIFPVMLGALGTRMIELAAKCCDEIETGGSGLMTWQSPKIIRDLSLDGIKVITKMCKENNLISHLHCCGFEKELVKMCAEETDLDIIEPLEPPPQGDCSLKELKQKYGEKLVFKGNLHTSEVMLADPKTVEIAAIKCIEDAAEGGGFILSTGDQCGRDTPHENIFKLVEVCERYGKY